jgi:hypothetical protein
MERLIYKSIMRFATLSDLAVITRVCYLLNTDNDGYLMYGMVETDIKRISFPIESRRCSLAGKENRLPFQRFPVSAASS